MEEFFTNLFESDFMPHGHCYYWQPEILWPVVIGDALTVFSYFLIPYLLWRFIRKRPDIKYTLLFKAFAAFILFCGFGHLIEIINIWEPVYRLSATVKMGTGLVSAGTVFLLFKSFPQAIKIPSIQALEDSNDALKKSNDELQKLYHELNQVMKTANMGNWEMDLETEKVNWSSMIYQIHELDEGTPIKLEDGLNFYHPESRPVIKEAVERCINDQLAYDLELRLVTAKSNVRWVRAIGRPIIEDGEVVKLKGLFLDINQTKLREQELVENELKLKQAQEIGHFGNWSWYLNTNKLEWSDERYRILGYEPNEVEPSLKLAIDAIDEADRKQVNETLERSIKAEQDYDLEYRIISKDGQSKMIKEKGHFLTDTKPDERILMGTVQDITHEHQTKQQLEQSLLALKRSNNELKNFAYVASHDLQEPLRVITSYLELIELDYLPVLDDTGKLYINNTVKASMRMKTLINDLLALSRIETQRRPDQQIDLNKLTSEVLEDVRISINEAGAAIETGDLPPILGDRVQIKQLMQNLIVNAIKFRNKESAPKISIHAEKRPNDTLYSVKDNGIGIEPQFFDRIFTIFQKLHTREEYSGTGIGLAMCKKIVEQHGGNIWVESTPGEGATFYFTIPTERTVNA